MYDQLYMDRGGRASHDLSVDILQGRVLGGGGVINTCDVVPIPEGVLHHWATKYGLEDFAPERFKRFTDDALGISPRAAFPRAWSTRRTTSFAREPRDSGYAAR